MNADQLAQLFHETYERRAPDFGYETRKATAIPWEEIPDDNANKRLMIAVAGDVLAVLCNEAAHEYIDDATGYRLTVERDEADQPRVTVFHPNENLSIEESNAAIRRLMQYAGVGYIDSARVEIQ